MDAAAAANVAAAAAQVVAAQQGLTEAEDQHEQVVHPAHFRLHCYPGQRFTQTPACKMAQACGCWLLHTFFQLQALRTNRPGSVVLVALKVMMKTDMKSESLRHLL